MTLVVCVVSAGFDLSRRQCLVCFMFVFACAPQPQNFCVTLLVSVAATSWRQRLGVMRLLLCSSSSSISSSSSSSSDSGSCSGSRNVVLVVVVIVVVLLPLLLLLL